MSPTIWTKQIFWICSIVENNSQSVPVPSLSLSPSRSFPVRTVSGSAFLLSSQRLEAAALPTDVEIQPACQNRVHSLCAECACVDLSRCICYYFQFIDLFLKIFFCYGVGVHTDAGSEYSAAELSVIWRADVFGCCRHGYVLTWVRLPWKSVFFLFLHFSLALIRR